MIEIDINLATRKRPRSKVPAVAVLLALVLAAVYTLYNADLYDMNKAEVARVKWRLVRLEANARAEAVRNPGMTVREVKRLTEEVEYINDVITRETFSWSGLLSGLEAAVPEKVSIVQIRPDFANRSVMVSGAAMSMGPILKFVDNLQGSAGFSDVFLLSHEEDKVKKGSSKRDSSRKTFISFDISSKYLGGEAR